MNFALLLIGLLSFAGAQIQVPLPAPPPPADGMVRVSLTSWDGSTLEIWDIERSRYDAFPVWSPETGPIPLTLSDALKAAEAVLTPQHPGVKTWFPMNTALLRDAGGRAWSYRVTLGVGTYAPGTTTGRFSLLVLLDGSVVEPKRYQGTPIAQNAIRARIQGDVRLSCVVNTDGSCEDITIIQSLDGDNGLDNEAINSLRQWRFTPGTLDGIPVKVLVAVELSFNLGDRK